MASSSAATPTARAAAPRDATVDNPKKRNRAPSKQSRRLRGLEESGNEEEEEEVDSPRRKGARNGHRGFGKLDPTWLHPSEYLGRFVTKVINGAPRAGTVVSFRGDVQSLFMVKYDEYGSEEINRKELSEVLVPASGSVGGVHGPASSATGSLGVHRSRSLPGSGKEKEISDGGHGGAGGGEKMKSKYR